MHLEGFSGETLRLSINKVGIKVYDSGLKRSYGEKPVLIFLHGSPGQISNWKYQINYFKNHYRVLALDQRGYGESDKPVEVSLNDYLMDLKGVMEERGVKQRNTVLIGHSFGGMVAQSYASENRVLGLVLIGSLSRFKPDFIDKVIWYLPTSLWRRTLFTENFLTRKLYRKIYFSDETPSEVFEEFLNDNKEYLESLPSHVFRYLRYFRDYNAASVLPRIETPTLIIVGEEDRVTPPRESERIHGLIPNSKLVIVKKAGHLVLYEKAQEINMLIHDFIRGVMKS